MMQPRIACLDLNAFFVEVTLKDFPHLRGRPVAVGGTSSRGVICSASYEARAYGVRSAMPVWMAKRRCPQLQTLPVSPRVEEFSHRVRERLELACPVVQAASIDEFYLDFTGCDRLYSYNLEIADRLVRLIDKNPGLPATIGFGSNKLIAKIASNLGKPHGILDIFPGTEARFLGPLPLKELPGVGPKMLETLESMGLSCIADIAALPLDMWRAAFGKTGEVLYRSAHGLHDSVVRRPEDDSGRKGVSREQTLMQDTASLALLLALLSRLVEKAAFALRQEGVTCGGISVKIRYSDFVTHTRSMRVERTNRDMPLFEAAAGLFGKLFNRRVKVRLVGIHLDGIQPGSSTPDLWDTLQPEVCRQLPELVDIIRARFGFRSLLRARSISSQRKKALHVLPRRDL